MPTIIHVINASKEEIKQKSVILYGKLLKTAITENELINNSSKLIGKYKSGDNYNILEYNSNKEVLKLNYTGAEVKCDFIKIYNNGEIYLKKCSVNGEKVQYEYGTKRACSESLDNNGYEIVNCNNEKFYILNKYLDLESEEKIIMFAAKNLRLVDNNYIQSDTAPTIKFDNGNYWVDDTCPYANNVSNRWKCNYKQKYIDLNEFVYDENAAIYNYINGYKNYLVDVLNIKSAETTLPSKEQLSKLGCVSNSCLNAPEWVYSTSYWSGNACDVTGTVLRFKETGDYECGWPNEVWGWGARPIVIISTEDLA